MRSHRNTKNDLEPFLITLHGVWMMRVELALAAVLGCLYYWLTKAIPQAANPRLAALVVLLSLSLAVALWPVGRYWIKGLLRQSALRRSWQRAVVDSGAHEPHTRTRRRASLFGPRVRKIERHPSGDLLTVALRRGGSIEKLQTYEQQLAACLSTPRSPVTEVRVLPIKGADRARVLIVRRDPFEHAPSKPWPPLAENELDGVSVWNPITVGYREDGTALTLKLVGSHFLIGGITGGGKSVFLRPLISTAALDQKTRLWLLDAKLVELAPWASAAEELVGRDGARALTILRQLQAIADERQREIVATGGDKIRRTSNLDVHVIVVDELANYAELDEGNDIMKALRDLASRGRALGIVVICATQVPHSDIIDTTLRNQFSTRIAFRCADRHHAGTILGQTDATALAAQISDRLPGVGYALDETGRYARFRSVFIGRPDDEAPARPDDVKLIAERAAERRVGEALEVALSPSNEVRRSTGATESATVVRASVEEVAAMVAEHLGDKPLTRSELAVLTGRHPKAAVIGKALTLLQERGAAIQDDKKRWLRAQPENEQSGDGA